MFNHIVYFCLHELVFGLLTDLAEYPVVLVALPTYLPLSSGDLPAHPASYSYRIRFRKPYSASEMHKNKRSTSSVNYHFHISFLKYRVNNIVFWKCSENMLSLIFYLKWLLINYKVKLKFQVPTYSKKTKMSDFQFKVNKWNRPFWRERKKLLL